MLRYLSALVFACSCLSPLAAARIGDVEYSLDQDVRAWKVGQRFQTSEGETIIYLPPGKKIDAPQSWEEVFTVQTSKVKMNLPALLQQDSVYGYGDLDYKILEETPEGVLLEWWTEGCPSMHAWARCLYSDGGTVCLQYMTMDPSRIDWARQVWEQILRGAKVGR